MQLQCPYCNNEIDEDYLERECPDAELNTDYTDYGMDDRYIMTCPFCEGVIEYVKSYTIELSGSAIQKLEE